MVVKRCAKLPVGEFRTFCFLLQVFLRNFLIACGGMPNWILWLTWNTYGIYFLLSNYEDITTIVQMFFFLSKMQTICRFKYIGYTSIQVEWGQKTIYIWKTQNSPKCFLLKNPPKHVASQFIYHWKNKLVVLTTEWLPQLQTSWRDSGLLWY